jgi:pimeloyl-ACP methyl ester carboxylesterase
MARTDKVSKNDGTGSGKKRNLFVKIIAGVIGAFVLFLGITYVVNVICNGIEKKKIQPYGQHVVVDGKNMNVSIQGDGEQTIVLLPGQGTPSPVLDFKLLIDELTPDYKVVAIEPFGYGLSDRTKKERTTENIVSEIHEAVQQLGIDRYILMGHSITGLYGATYINTYPEEVIAFVGIDSSVPNQPGMDAKLPLNTMEFLQKSGLMRLMNKVSGDSYESLAYDARTKEQMKLISNQVSYNPTMINELKHLGSNFKNGENLTYPSDFPLLLFVQSNNENNPNWIPLHEEQVKQSSIGKMIPMEGSHYLHHTKYKEIAEAFKDYMKQIGKQTP